MQIQFMILYLFAKFLTSYDNIPQHDNKHAIPDNMIHDNNHAIPDNMIHDKHVIPDNMITSMLYLIT